MGRFGTSYLDVASLLRRGWNSPPMLRGHFCARRSCGGSAVAAVVADVVHCHVVDHGFVVDVCNVRRIDVIYRPVVEEGSIPPVAAFIAPTGVSVAVVDPAVETYHRTPVAFAPDVSTVIRIPRPIAGSPECPLKWRKYPGAWNPEVTVRPPSPITRRPDITRAGAVGLLVHGQRFRCDCDHDTDGCLSRRCRRQREHNQTKKKNWSDSSKSLLQYSFSHKESLPERAGNRRTKGDDSRH